MNILVVRPLISQIRALITQETSVFAACLWEKTQDPNLTPIIMDENKDIKWLSWYPNSFYLFSMIEKVKFFIRTYKTYQIDIVHLNGLRDLLFAYSGRLFSPIKPKIVVISHNPNIWEKPLLRKIVSSFIKFFSDGCIALSSSHQKILIKNGIPEKKTGFIPNAFINEITEKNEIIGMKNGKNLFYAASLIPRKNQLTLLKAFNNVQRKHTDIKLYLAGEMDTNQDYVNELKTYLSENNLSTSVFLLGKISHKDVLSYCDQSTIIVFPTRAEMMPRAVIEAMWLGKPVIASKVDGINDLIRDGETGCLCDPDDIDSLSDAINNWIENPRIAVQIGKNGQDFVQKFCSLETVGKSTINFYNFILQNSFVEN